MKSNKAIRYVIKSQFGKYVRKMRSSGYSHKAYVDDIADAHMFRRLSDAMQSKTLFESIIKVKIKVKVIE